MQIVRRRSALWVAVFVLAASSCAGALTQQPEPNSAGDIPDTQAFVTYRSAEDKYQIEVPEGWARATPGRQVRFSNKLNAVSVSVERVAGPPEPAALRAAAMAGLPATGATVLAVRRLKLDGKDVTLVHFTSRSLPDPVTDKSVELSNDAYFFYRDHRLARVLLSGAVAADNADQWQRMAKSFRWR